jgi:hypothetical protein
MKEDNENNNEVSTCPKIELGTHQNSYNPKNTETRDDKK